MCKNESYFECSNTEEKAYWLGFLFADGCILSSGLQVSIILNEKDSKHLEKLAEIFDRSVRHETVYDSRTEKTYARCRLVLSSKKLVNDLKKFGIVPRKTYSQNDIPWDNIPLKYHRHFIRGIFDGDGYIGIIRNEIRMSICANEPIANSLKQIVGNSANLSSASVHIERKKNMNLYIFQSVGKTNIWKIREYLYKDATIYLDRKANIFFGPPPYGNTWFRGVHYDKRKKKWIASKIINGRRIYAGCSFNSAEEAALAYDKLLLENNIIKNQMNYPQKVVEANR